MRALACEAWVKLFGEKEFVFLTGDLGYNALEPLRDTMGENFINAGVAEQNMVSLAAGLHKSGFETWVYSIAPFCYARPFEQIRNDICLHQFPVKLVGNGGGYGYGPMGATHHALEDYGVLLTLQHMHVFVPAFADDVWPCVQRMSALRKPAYLRLGRDEKPPGAHIPPYSPWRRLLTGQHATLLCVGPLVGGIQSALMGLAPETRPGLWVLTELPLSAHPIPPEFISDLRQTQRLIVIEEHVAHGSTGQMIAYDLLKLGIQPKVFEHHCAKGYVSGNYGSQNFHRRECGIDPASIVSALGGWK